MITNKNLCLSLANKSFDDSLNVLKKVELAELRLDLLEFDDLELSQLFSLETEIIATCRYGRIEDSSRMKILTKAIDLGSDYIDIELDADESFVSEMIAYAKQKSCKIILSYHNFEHTPSIEKLQKIIDEASCKKADLIKISCLANSEGDAERILNLYKNNNNIIAFGMGDFGKESRIKSLKLGAEFTYVALAKGEETAPGQWTLDEIQKELNLT